MILGESLRLRIASGLKLYVADLRRNGTMPAREVLDTLDVLLSGPEGTELALEWQAREGESATWASRISPAAVDAVQAARALGVSVKTVRRRIAAGDIPSSRVGRRVLIPREAIEDLVKGRVA